MLILALDSGGAWLGCGLGLNCKQRQKEGETSEGEKKAKGGVKEVMEEKEKQVKGSLTSPFVSEMLLLKC